MSRVYALIKHKENVASAFYRSITYEKVSGYPIDSNILFFSSLVEAKISAQLPPQITINFFNTLSGIDTVAIRGSLQEGTKFPSTPLQLFASLGCSQ